MVLRFKVKWQYLSPSLEFFRLFLYACIQIMALSWKYLLELIKNERSFLLDRLKILIFKNVLFRDWNYIYAFIKYISAYIEMAKKSTMLFRLLSSAGTGYFYVGKKNVRYKFSIFKGQSQKIITTQIRSISQSLCRLQRGQNAFRKKKNMSRSHLINS